MKAVYHLIALLLSVLSWLCITGFAHRETSVLEYTAIDSELTVEAAVPTPMELEADQDVESDQPELDIYWTVGGMRLGLLFDEDDLTEEERALNPVRTWVFSVPGRVCRAHLPSDSCQDLPSDTPYSLDSAVTPEIDNFKVYWEPLNWDLDLSVDVEVTYDFRNRVVEIPMDGNVFTVDFPERKEQFRIANRVIGPAADGEEPLQGSDVAMLEQMLWQLGYGPNNSRRKGNYSIRKADDRNVFDVGCNVGGCSHRSNPETSMEWMAWRFKFANELTARGNVSGEDVTLESTALDHQAISVLKKHWEDYFQAYLNNSGSPIINAGNQTRFVSWLEASDGWQLGDVEIYTSGGVSRSDILNSIASKESGDSTRLSSGIHWGAGGSNDTPFRINQGSADSWASFGFSQIKSRYIYGQFFGARSGSDPSACEELNGHNPYSPDGALESIVQFSMGRNGSCGRSFRLALSGQYTASYQQVNGARIVRIEGDSSRDVPVNSNALIDDGYDRLSKAIGAYNQGAGVFGNVLSWPGIIKDYSGYSGSDADIIAMRKAVAYSLRVKRTAGFSLRNYVWQTTESRNPTPSWPADSFSYCFTFGESNWGESWSQARSRAREIVLNSNGLQNGCD
ncbi:hypothetical protein GCM10011297_35230 [Bacterioplanes sanyensis]|uniref:hypothetical protein n=1 Tax=Bacterioplanes sanyensis TaxID=1249553 RepID=UPI001676E792|nr:hypothetical protein [Bacterioplanes sanyensis]GGY59774.1 hypothetical protein GCM10011297_35230 [Bacterioplanes sanyensis]